MSIDNTTQSVNVKAFDMTKEATLVKLSITKYGGNKKDKGLAEESAEKHEMNADVVSTTLTVLDKTVTKIVGKIASAARTWLNHNAAVYDDTGWRMIRNSQFEKIRTQLEAYKLEFMEAVNENIISKYDALREQAVYDLGGRFDMIGFPSKDELASRYTFEVKTQMVTDPDDVRCSHLPQSTIDEIKGGNNAVAVNNQKKILDLLKHIAKHIKETLSDPDKKFKNSLITNIHDAIDVVPSLNFTNDPTITQMAARLKKDLSGFNPDDLRKDPEVRKEAAAKAGTMLDDLANANL